MPNLIRTLTIALAALPPLAAQSFFAPTRTPLPFGAPAGSSNRDLTMNADETVCVFASDRPGGAGGWDLYIARRNNRGLPWTFINAWPFNTPADETGPGLSADGRELYFARKGGGRDADILVSTAPTGTTQFGAPARVDALSIAGSDDTGPQPTIDGRRLFFHSDRRGGGDLFVATRTGPNAAWSAPQPLVGVNDGSAADYDPAPEAGGAVLWFARRAPGGDAELYLTWQLGSSGTWAAPIVVGELNGTGDQDGPFVAAVSGLTYFNGPSGALDIGLECVCRSGPVGKTPATPTGWADGRTSAAWNVPVLLSTGASWGLGRSATQSFFDWSVTGPINYVPAISPRRASTPLVLPVIEWGAVELGAPDIVTLAPVAVDADGYAESTFQVPNLPQLRGQVLWSQAFGVTAAGKLQMTPPERITLR